MVSFGFRLQPYHQRENSVSSSSKTVPVFSGLSAEELDLLLQKGRASCKAVSLLAESFKLVLLQKRPLLRHSPKAKRVSLPLPMVLPADWQSNRDSLPFVIFILTGASGLTQIVSTASALTPKAGSSTPQPCRLATEAPRSPLFSSGGVCSWLLYCNRASLVRGQVFLVHGEPTSIVDMRCVFQIADKRGSERQGKLHAGQVFIPRTSIFSSPAEMRLCSPCSRDLAARPQRTDRKV